MEQGLLYEICGMVASVGMILGYLPQAVETIRTRNTEGIALPTFMMMAVGGFAFMLQGLLHKPDIIWSLFLTNRKTERGLIRQNGIGLHGRQRKHVRKSLT